jgi:O-antigen ligase
VFVGEDQTKFFGPHAHNEVIQAGFELGVVGLVIIAAWVWRHRRALASPACVALGVLSLGVFPFHTAGVAMAALLVIADALANEPLSEPARGPAWVNSIPNRYLHPQP